MKLIQPLRKIAKDVLKVDRIELMEYFRINLSELKSLLEAAYELGKECSLCRIDKICPGCELEKALPNPQNE